MPRLSYSQVGEDLQIAYLLGATRGLRYIDIGCLWPVEHSNTYLFYREEGRGVCIEANPEAGPDYEAERPRDVFLNVAVGATRRTMVYHMFESPTFNTFSRSRAERVITKADQKPSRALRKTLEIPVVTLDEALERVDVPTRSDGRIDFISIDVEGLELDVMQGFSFRPRPRLIVCEQIRRRSQPAPESQALDKLLNHHGYWLAAYTGHDVFYLAEDA